MTSFWRQCRTLFGFPLEVPESTAVDPERWQWADQITSFALQQMAEVGLPLMLRPDRWIHRRVERIGFIDRQTVHRQVSVDFTLPTSMTPVGDFEGRHIYLAPLFLLKRDHPRPLRMDREWHWWAWWRSKHPRRLPMSLFSDLTFVDKAGERLPLLTRRQSTILVNAMLYQAAAEVLKKPLSEDLKGRLADVAFGDREHRKYALRDIFVYAADNDRRQLRDADYFAELACMMATHLPVVCLFTDGPPGRSIAKLSYVEPLDPSLAATKGRVFRGFGLKSENLGVGVNEIGGGASHHIEVAIPKDLQVNYVSLTGKSYTYANVEWQKLKDDQRDYVIRQVGTASSGNIYLSGLKSARRMGRISIKMRVKRTGFLMGALAVSGIITVVLAVMAMVAPDVLAKENSDASVAALLLLPTIVAAYIARPGEHMLTARMLRLTRFVLVANASLPFLAVMVFFTTRASATNSSGVNLGGFIERTLAFFQPQNSPVHGLEARWAWLAVFSFFCTCYFLIINIWPRPHGVSKYSPLPDETNS